MLSMLPVLAEEEGSIFVLPCGNGDPKLRDIILDYHNPKQPGWIFLDCEILAQSPVEFGFSYRWRLRAVPGVM